MNTIAERIKFAMRAKNKKQVDIVKDTGISKGAFSSYLSGQYNPKADKMELIADSLDVDLRWLYGQNVPMEHTSKMTTLCNMSFTITPVPSIFLII
jgi:transcriptional regulator with XRE-family HTH domain